MMKTTISMHLGLMYEQKHYILSIITLIFYSLKGYQKRCCFIAAQSPLENTVGHFWKMLIEQQSSTIVMLCNLVENHQVSISSISSSVFFVVTLNNVLSMCVCVCVCIF